MRLLLVINSTADENQNSKGYLLVEPSITSKSRTCSLYISIIWTPTLYSMTSSLVFDIWNKSHKARKFTPHVSLVFKSYPLYQKHRKTDNMLYKWILNFFSIQAICHIVISSKGIHFTMVYVFPDPVCPYAKMHTL